MDAESFLTAIAECAACRGRECGDCDSACHYWQLTASPTEIAAEQARDGQFDPSKRGNPQYRERMPKAVYGEWEDVK